MSFTLSEKNSSNSSPATDAPEKMGESRGSGVGKTAKNHKFIFYGLDRPNQRGGSRTFKQKDKFIHYDVSATKSFTKTVDDIISTTTSQGISSALVGGAAATKNTDCDATRDRSSTAITDMRAVAAAAAAVEVRRYRKKSRFINYGLQDEGEEPDLIVEHQQNHSSGVHGHGGHDAAITGTEPILSRAADASTCLFRLKPSHNVPVAASSSIISRNGGSSSNNNSNNNNNNNSSSRNSVALMGVFAASPKSDIWAHFHKTVLGDQQYTDKRTGKLKWEVRYECRFENCKYVGYASKIQGSTSPLRYHYKTHVKAATEAAAAAVGGAGTGTAAVDTISASLPPNDHDNAAGDDVDGTTTTSTAAAAAAAAAHDDATHNINTLVADFLTKHGLPPAVVDDSLFRYLLRTGPLADGAIMNSSEMGQLLHMRRQLAGLSASVNAGPDRQGAGSVGTPADGSSGHDNVNAGDTTEKRQKLS